MTNNFFHIDDLTQGLARELANGVTARIFPQRQAMLCGADRPQCPRDAATATQRSSGAL